MSLTAQQSGIAGDLASQFAKGQDEFMLMLIDAEPFYASLRIKLTFSGSRSRMDGTTEIEEVFSGFLEETFSRAELPIASFVNLGSWASVDDGAGTFEMAWDPDAAYLGSDFPATAGTGNFCMALDLAGKIYDSINEFDQGLPPDPKKPRHRYQFESDPTPTVIGERTTTPDGGSPTSEDIEWTGVGTIYHTYSDSAGEDFETNRIGYDVLRHDLGGGAVIDTPTTGWSAARWRDQRALITGTWTDDDPTWDTSTFQIAAEIELS